MPYRAWIIMTFPTHVIFRYHLLNACAVYADDFELTPKNKLFRSRPLNCNLHFRKPCQAFANLMSCNFVIMMIFVTYYDSFMYKKVFG